MLQLADADGLNKTERRNSNDASSKLEPAATVTKPVSNTANYTSTTSSNKLSKENVNADDEDGISKSSHTNDNNKDTSKEKDELVLDVLNDDLIEKVRGKISCKYARFHLLRCVLDLAQFIQFSSFPIFFLTFVCLSDLSSSNKVIGLRELIGSFTQIAYQFFY